MRKIRRRRERRVGKAFKDFDVGPCQSAKLSRALVRGTIFHLLRIPKSSLHSILSRQWFGNLGEVFRLRNTSVLESLFVKGVQGPPCSRVLIAPLVLLCSLSQRSSRHGAVKPTTIAKHIHGTRVSPLCRGKTIEAKPDSPPEFPRAYTSLGKVYAEYKASNRDAVLR